MTQVNYYGFNQRSQSLHFRKGQYDPNTQSVPDESFLNGDARDVQDGRYYKGDGVDAYVDTGFKLSSEFNSNITEFSWGCWFNVNDASSFSESFGNLLGDNSGIDSLGIYMKDNGFIFGFIGDGSDAYYLETNDSFDDGNWHSIVLTLDSSGNFKFYIDNSQYTNLTTIADNGIRFIKPSGSNQIILGRISRYWLDGCVFAPFFYNGTMTTNQIDQYHNLTFDWSKMLRLWACDEGGGTDSFDKLGNEVGTIKNANLSTFHASGDDAPYSFQNNVGYTYDSVNNRYIPRDESNTDKDVQGNSLQYKGKVPYTVYAKDSNSGYVDNVGEELQFVNNVPSGSTLSYSGTAGLSLDVGNDKITVSSAGTLYDIVVTDSNGDRWSRLVASEGNNDKLYDVILNSSNNANIVNASLSTFWGQTQDSFHWNIEGFDLWVDGSGNKLYVPFDENGNSIKTQGDTISGFSWDSKHEPSTDFHNGAETRFDTVGDDPHFGDFKRAVSDTGIHPSNSVSGDDRYYIRKLPEGEADKFTLYLNDQVDPQKLKTQLFTQ